MQQLKPSMKTSPIPPWWLPALTLAACFAASTHGLAVPEAPVPQPLPAAPAIPPPDIPEEPVPGLVLRQLAFDREFD
jgi:hypothetical protein